MNMFGVWFYAPFLLCLPLLFWPKWPHYSPFKRQVKYWLLIPLSLFVVEYGAYFWPNLDGLAPLTGQTSTSIQSSTHLPIRVMTWNIHKDTVDAEAISQSIIEQDADIVAIQELGVDMAKPLAIALTPTYPYQALAPSDRPDEFAVFSRYPIDSMENSGRGNRDCDCQITHLQMNDQSLALFNVHLPTPKLVKQHIGPLPWVTDLSTAQQRRNLDVLLDRINATPEPLIALGDFNASDRHDHYRLLSKVVQDAFREGGFGFGLTYPAVPKVGLLPFTPVVRLDYIWHRGTFTAQRAWTGTGSIADHQFLVADLTER